MKMIEFFTSYIWLAIGFMMMFIILFSFETSLNIKSFPGALVNILVMMLGEINYNDLYFPSNQELNFTLTNNTGKGEISEEPVYQHFPVTAHLTLILFILVFCLVIANLLVGLAVSDIQKLKKSGKRDQLVAQVELLSSVENFRQTKLFLILPGALRRKLERYDQITSWNSISFYLSSLLDHSCCDRDHVKYSDILDKKYPETLKRMLYDFCLR